MFLFWSGEKNEGMWGIGIRSGEWSLAGENPGPPPPAVTLRGPDFNQLVSEDITMLLSVAGLVFPLSMRNRIQLRERERKRRRVCGGVSHWKWLPLKTQKQRSWKNTYLFTPLHPSGTSKLRFQSPKMASFEHSGKSWDLWKLQL